MAGKRRTVLVPGYLRVEGILYKRSIWARCHAECPPSPPPVSERQFLDVKLASSSTGVLSAVRWNAS